MNFYIQQSIHINLIKIGALSNSSVLQIGSAGMIKSTSNLYNTGGFTKPAPKITNITTGDNLETPAVPLSIS